MTRRGDMNDPFVIAGLDPAIHRANNEGCTATACEAPPRDGHARV
jgi:hypothetical protein